MTDIIPEKFYRGDRPHPIAYSVGELKQILNELPDNLPIECSLDYGVKLTVYNHGTEDMHLQLEDTVE